MAKQVVSTTAQQRAGGSPKAARLATNQPEAKELVLAKVLACVAESAAAAQGLAVTRVPLAWGALVLVD